MNPKAESRLAPRLKLPLHQQFHDYLAGKPVYPINLEISPSGVCNASCDFCFYAAGDLGDHRNIMLDFGYLASRLDEAADLGVKSITWTGGGEPSLYRFIGEAVETVVQVGMEQGIFTNALLMPRYDPAAMAWIRVTMTDKPYRVDCIKPLRAAKALGFAFNYAGEQDDAYLWETLGVAEQVDADYVQVRPALRFHGQTVDIKPPRMDHPLLHVTDYKFEEARHKHGYERCEAYHLNPFVWETGDVTVCAYMRLHDGYKLGNIYRDTLKDILDRAPASVPVIDQCQVCCKLHESNLAIHAARSLEDRNFP